MKDNGSRILIADDDETFLLATTDLLRREGYECYYAPDAMTVIEIL
jgi:DNA-binding response OmpR family regulator